MVKHKTTKVKGISVLWYTFDIHVLDKQTSRVHVVGIECWKVCLLSQSISSFLGLVCIDSFDKG